MKTQNEKKVQNKNILNLFFHFIFLMTFLCRNTKTSLHEFILCAGKIMIRDNRRKSNLMWQTEKHRAELGPAAYFVFVFISILIKRVTNSATNTHFIPKLMLLQCHSTLSVLITVQVFEVGAPAVRVINLKQPNPERPSYRWGGPHLYKDWALRRPPGRYI